MTTSAYPSVGAAQDIHTVFVAPETGSPGSRVAEVKFPEYVMFVPITWSLFVNMSLAGVWAIELETILKNAKINAVFKTCFISFLKLERVLPFHPFLST